MTSVTASGTSYGHRPSPYAYLGIMSAMAAAANAVGGAVGARSQTNDSEAATWPVTWHSIAPRQGDPQFAGGNPQVANKNLLVGRGMSEHGDIHSYNQAFVEEVKRCLAKST